MFGTEQMCYGLLDSYLLKGLGEGYGVKLKWTLADVVLHGAIRTCWVADFGKLVLNPMAVAVSQKNSCQRPQEKSCKLIRTVFKSRQPLARKTLKS